MSIIHLFTCLFVNPITVYSNGIPILVQRGSGLKLNDGPGVKSVFIRCIVPVVYL